MAEKSSAPNINNNGKPARKGCKGIVVIVLAIFLILGIFVIVNILDYAKSISSIKELSNENLSPEEKAEKLQTAGLDVMFKTVAKVEQFKGQFQNENELINFMMSNASTIDSKTGLTTTKLSSKAVQMQSEENKAKDIIDFVYIFKKVPNCSMETKNCYVYIYTDVKKDEKPKRKGVIYFDKNGDFELIED